MFYKRSYSRLIWTTILALSLCILFFPTSLRADDRISADRSPERSSTERSSPVLEQSMEAIEGIAQDFILDSLEEECVDDGVYTCSNDEAQASVGSACDWLRQNVCANEGLQDSICYNLPNLPPGGAWGCDWWEFENRCNGLLDSICGFFEDLF